ncbi:MAG: hypothetical protein WAU05_01760, partial [Nitrospira sp.]
TSGIDSWESRYNNVSLHAHSFVHRQPIRAVHSGVLMASIIRMEREVNDSTSFLFHGGPARI